MAVQLQKRSGAPIRVCAGWDSRPDQRWTRYAELLRHRALSSKLPYDLSKLIELYDRWEDAAALPEALRRDVLRVVRDKQPKAGRKYLPEIERIVGTLAGPGDLARLCDELLVARQLASAMGQAAAASTLGRPLEETVA